MAYDEKTNAINMPAAAALPQGRFVKVATGGKVELCAAADDDPVGVSYQAATAADENIAVVVADGAKVRVQAGAALTPSAGVVQVTSDATGRAVAVQAGAPGAGERVYGYALTDAGAADEFITVLFLKAASHRDA